MATKKKTQTERPLIGSSHKKGVKKGTTKPRVGSSSKPKSSADSTERPSKSSAKRAPKSKASRPTSATKKPSGVGVRKTRTSATKAPARTTKPRSTSAKGEPLRRIASTSAPDSGRAVKPRRMTEVRSAPSDEARALAVAIASAALEKKAINVQIFDVVGRVDYADYLVLMSGRSDRHTLAIADGIEEHLVKQQPKRKPTSVEGRPQGNWVVLDFGDVVAHVFQESARSHYDLDSFWQDARRVPVAPGTPPAGTETAPTT